MKRGQSGIEYMILIGFITFIISTVLIASIIFSDRIKDRIKMNQAEDFAIQLLNAAEVVFFAGVPSKTTIKLYLPSNVKAINITSDYLILKLSTSTGENIRGFRSKVPLNGSIEVGEGLKTIVLEAKPDYVLIH